MNDAHETLRVADAVAACVVAARPPAAGSAAGTGGSGIGFSPRRRADRELGRHGEGALDVLAWPGYAENGSTDPTVDWVTPFEDATGCKVNVQVVRDVRRGVQPVHDEPEPVRRHLGVRRREPAPRRAPATSSRSTSTSSRTTRTSSRPSRTSRTTPSTAGHYGVPHGRGANLLMWRTDKVTPAPTTLGRDVRPDQPYAGKITVYDAPIYIADAARRT